jgi:hypothetical protein
MAVGTAAWQPSALHPCAAVRRVKYANPSPLYTGAGLLQGYALTLESVARKDRRQFQI